MVYYTQSGQEIEDAEGDNMRRDSNFFYCIDCQEWKPQKDGQYVENYDNKVYIGQVWICNKCIEES